MNEQQVHELFWAVVCFAGALPLTVSAVIAVWRGRRRTEVRWIAAVVAWWGGLSFLASAAAAEDSGGLFIGVLADFLTAVPVIFTIAYACAMQARRYPGARDRQWLRYWFSRSRSYPLLFGVLLASALLNALYPYQITDDSAPAPIRAVFFQGPLVAFQCLFALGAAFVFYEALTTRLPQRRPNVQNASAAVLMAAFALEALLRCGLLGTRVWGSVSQIDFAATAFLTTADVLIMLELLSAVVAVGAYYSRSAVSHISGRLLNFFDLGRRIEDTFNNVPIHKPQFSGPYAYLNHAVNDENLALTESEVQKANEGYRLMVLYYRNGILGSDGNRISYKQFLDLLRVYEADLNDPEISEQAPVKRRAETHSLYEVYTVIEPLLSTKGADHSLNWIFTERWAQLVYVAAADAGLLSTHMPDVKVLPEIRRTYELGKSKVWHEAIS